MSRGGASARAAWGGGAALAALLPGEAQAHLATTRFGDFYGGALHLATTPEHLLAIVALGLLAGLQAPRDGRWLLAAAPLGLLVGAVSGLLLPPAVPTTAAALVLLTALGLLTALAWPARALPLAALGLAVGLLHGYENGLAAGAVSVAALFVAGVASSGLVCLALIAAGAVTAGQRAAWGAIGLRAGGSWIAALGLMMLGFTLV